MIDDVRRLGSRVRRWCSWTPRCPGMNGSRDRRPAHQGIDTGSGTNPHDYHDRRPTAGRTGDSARRPGILGVAALSDASPSDSPSYSARDLNAPLSSARDKRDVEAFKVVRRPEQLRDIDGARVLLVEDNTINQQVAREILEQAGLAVDLANDGKEAVELAEKHKYDVILMDIQMPVMDGFAATNQIRNSKSKNRNVPIVAMTAHAMAGDREKSIAAGMVDHVTKPIDPAELCRILLKWIKPDKGRRKGRGRRKKKLKTSETPMPSSLPGMDMANGLSRVGGNENLYRGLLKDFYKDYSDAAGKIRESLVKEDKELGARLAHTVKGVAGNLGSRGPAKLPPLILKQP